MSSSIFYLDNSMLSNPNFSDKVNVFYRIFNAILGVIYLSFILYFLIKKGDFTKIPYLIHATVFMGIMISQQIIFKKYGRKFLQCTENSLILKHRYFDKSVSIPWEKVLSIEFIEKSFIIHISDSILNEIKFNAPLDRYLDIRKNLKDYSNKYNIKIVE